MKDILNSPTLYQTFQQVGGFFGARIKAINEFLPIKDGTRIVDIGCGPGYILKYINKNVDYIGFDIDKNYIEHANHVFGDRGKFYCRLFDANAARDIGQVDIVMMNGVLHHISDEDLASLLNNVASVLKPGGILFSLDGCYTFGQSKFRKWMLDNDRGRFVRTEDGYRTLLETSFDKVDLFIRDNYSRVPYTFVVGISQKSDKIGR
ncbi:class I SAM-dependent methyltransferase [Ancylobacter sp. VKM B-3255]|uniref:Class I SAM-dependent methyltransferase n=1 Tax=Ancylobacter radicis TaxID=2836179 RepID=A0ABS5RB44_9HYPH|nr:class I SAM-dependent methyltransferase [Ancylobacter radicis]